MAHSTTKYNSKCRSDIRELLWQNTWSISPVSVSISGELSAVGSVENYKCIFSCFTIDFIIIFLLSFTLSTVLDCGYFFFFQVCFTNHIFDFKNVIAGRTSLSLVLLPAMLSPNLLFGDFSQMRFSITFFKKTPNNKLKQGSSNTNMEINSENNQIFMIQNFTQKSDSMICNNLPVLKIYMTDNYHKIFLYKIIHERGT